MESRKHYRQVNRLPDVILMAFFFVPPIQLPPCRRVKQWSFGRAVARTDYYGS